MNIQEIPQQASILCPTCGIKFSPTMGNICMNCTITRTDITLGITKQSVLNYCRFCHRYLRPPWVFCERESRQLLAICLKKIKGLNKVKLLNAVFIWTQPHSKRIKVKITISKQINSLSNIQQTFIVEFIQAYTQCDDCKKEFTPHTWGAIVQVRQHVDHKKTFYFIQQLILKHNAHEKVLKVEEQEDGINFYYKNTTHAQRLIDFLGSLLPTVVKTSKQLVSHDQSSNTFVYKYGFSVELPKICREDLVIIPKKLATALGGCSQLLLCWKVTNVIHLIDLATYRTVQMNSLQYFHYQKDIQLLPLNIYKSQFIVLDSTASDKKFNLNNSTTILNNKLYNLVITRKQQWENIEVKCHLGDLPCGQIIQGFDLRFLTYNQQINNFKGVPQIIIVRKQKDAQKKRAFKLKRLENQGVMVQQSKKKKKNQGQEKQYQQFLDDIAVDKQLRKAVKLYADKEVLDNLKEQQKKQALGDIQLMELFDDLKIDDSEPNLYSNDMEGIDQLVTKLEKVNIVEK